MSDSSTCAERLSILAAQPEYAAIHGELLLAAAELKALRDLLGDMRTIDGWRRNSHYVNTGTCHGCGQDIYELPPLSDPRWQKVPGSDYDGVVQRSGDKFLPDL